MFVRLAFANAISVDPDILIVDEALSVGDIFFQQKCHARMEKLIQNGVTIIVVSHDMAAIEKYSDRALLLDQGRCIFLGHPNEAVHKYYALLHSPPIPAAVLPVSEAAKRDGETTKQGNAANLDWPPAHAFLDMFQAVVIGQAAAAKCTGIAVCDESGKSRTNFEIGETAYFYYEFESLQSLDVPIGGIEIINNMNIVLHSKSSMHYLVEAPPLLQKGRRIRFRQTIQLSLAPGEYTFIIALATMKAEDYHHAQALGTELLHSKITPLLRISRTGIISVTEKRTGLKLPFYGYVDLEGSLTCELQTN
jgi:hypothetical protein